MGTTEAITDQSQNIVWAANYDSFGKVQKTSGTFDEEGLFTGKELDDVTGMYYFNARFYDPGLGRFISEDPARDGGNWYG